MRHVLFQTIAKKYRFMLTKLWETMLARPHRSTILEPTREFVRQLSLASIAYARITTFENAPALVPPRSPNRACLTRRLSYAIRRPSSRSTAHARGGFKWNQQPFH